MTTLHIILTALGAALLAGGFSAWYFTRRVHRKVSYMLDAMEDGELNFRFDEKKKIGGKINRTLNRVRGIYEKERSEILEQERFYGQMLDHVRTGILVEEDGKVIYTNKAANDTLGLPALGHIRQLKNIDESLYCAFRDVNSHRESRASFYDERGQKSILLTASNECIGGKNVKVITFNDVTGEMEQNEEISWNRLIRVLTHEIMNTVTPVASLSQTLTQEVEGFSGQPGYEELKSGLQTIYSSSRGLIKFVESYRNLTRVPLPVKRAFYLKELMERVLNLTHEQAAGSGVQCLYIEKTEDILLYADENQIAQILINLIKNAIQAGASKVEITATIDLSESVVIDVANNGRPISRESQEQIFVPFFTTKQEGTGIGLSLSRQIMRLHHGSINLSRSDERMTVFTLIFK